MSATMAGMGLMSFDLLRLEGYTALQIEEVDKKLYIDVVPDAPKVPTCTCDSPDVVKHGKRVVHFRDHPLQRQETYLRITRQRYRCRHCASILLEDLPFIDDKRRMTWRFRDQLAHDGIDMKFELGGNINGVRESMVRRVFKDYAKERLKDYTYDLPRVLGMDEKDVSGSLRFIIGDVENRHLLDIQPSRKLINIEQYFSQWDFRDRAKVEVITQDMHWNYKTLNLRFFRKATIVVDKFHVLRYADYAVTAVRKAVQSRMENDDRVAMKKNIPLLQARPHRLNDQGKFALKRLLRQHPLISDAVTFKEWFYDIYKCETPAEADKAFKAWQELLPKELEPAFKPILSYMRERRWRRFILNYFEHRYTNAYVEAVNGLIDEISRTGRGYDLETLRAKALLKYGNLERLTDRYDFALRLGDPESERIENTMIGHGVNLSTFERDLREGRF